MSLANITYNATYTWANPFLLTLEQQAAVPLFGTSPIELGMNGKESEIVARLSAESRYQALFPLAFQDQGQPISVANALKAIAAFERTLLSGDAPFDRFQHGDASALNDSAKRGFELFTSEKLECFHCHNGFNLVDSLNYACKGSLEPRFHNTGLYNIDGNGAYPSPNTGIREVTDRPEDMGRFRAPTLRNIAVTAPYMQDGSIATLSEVLDHYGSGGRTISSGPYAGNGSLNPFKSGLLKGFTLTAQERADVLAFLDSLTDNTFLTNPAHSNPWSQPCTHCP
jgi:cytochrome c peroxidase